MSETITIPTPHVPHGPEGIPRNVADADYMRAAVRNIKHQSRGERLWGSNLTATIVKLLEDVADALEQKPRCPACGLPSPCGAETPEDWPPPIKVDHAAFEVQR